MAAGDFEAAILELEKSIELSEQIGDDALELQVVAENALPSLYFQKAQNFLKAKDFSSTLRVLESTIVAAEKVNNSDIKERAERQLPVVYLSIGNELRSQSPPNFDEAIANFDKVISLNPDLAQSYFLKGVCYESMRNEPDMDENYKLAIEKGREFSDVQTSRQAQERLRNYHRNAGARFSNEAQTMQNNKRPQRDIDAKFNEAIVSFNKAIEADERDFDSYRGLLTSFNGIRRWDDAIISGEKAIEIRDSGTGVDAVWFGLGVAYAEKKNNAKACECFKNVRAENLRKAVSDWNNILKCK